MRYVWVGLGFLAISLGVATAQAQDAGKDAFNAGVTLLQDPDGARYDEALPLFKQAYELTKSWKVLGNLGLCYMKLERYGEAIETYQRYLKEGGNDIETEERTQVTADLRTMQTQRVTLHLTLKGSDSAQLRDERLRPSGGALLNEYAVNGSATLVIAPGNHTFTASNGRAQDTWTVRLEPASEVSHIFELTRSGAAGASAPSASTTPSRVPAYVAGGVTLLLAGGTTVTGIMALGKRSDFHAINGEPGHDRNELQSARDDASRLGLISTVLLGATVVGAGVTTWLFVSPPGGSSKEAAATALRVGPWMGLDGAGLVAEGSL